MNKLFFAILLSVNLLVQTSCNDTNANQEYYLLGTWKVTELTNDSLSITNYGEGKISKDSKIRFDRGNFFQIYLNDSTKIPESFTYHVENNIIFYPYSDYFKEIKIKMVTKNKLELGLNNKSEINNSEFDIVKLIKVSE